MNVCSMDCDKMAVTEENMFLENLEEFVNDENQIVTYKWLSRTLKVHVNVAKRMLFSFVDHERRNKDNTKLNVTYLVAGLKEVDGKMGQHVSLVLEDNLEVAKSSLKSVTSCHIYSVQRSKLKDSYALYIVDFDSFRENLYESNRYSAITCKAAIPRSTDDITTLTKNSNKEAAIKQEKAKVEQMKNAPKPKGIAGMFAKAAEKKAQENSSAINKDTDKPVKKDDKTKPKGMMAFMGKKSDISAKDADKMSTKGKVQDKETNETEITPIVVDIVVDGEKENKNSQNRKSSKSETIERRKDKGKKSSRRGSDKEDKQSSKRRRIRNTIDSSSDEEDAEPESPVPSPPPPEAPQSPLRGKEAEIPEVERVTIEVDGKVKRRKRVRKTVAETYLDDDGYMVTRNKFVFESCTDDSEPEEPLPSAKNSATAAKAKIDEKLKASRKKPPQNKHTNKQTSLMSFFQKK